MSGSIPIDSNNLNRTSINSDDVGHKTTNNYKEITNNNKDEMDIEYIDMCTVTEKLEDFKEINKKRDSITQNHEVKNITGEKISDITKRSVNDLKGQQEIDRKKLTWTIRKVAGAILLGVAAILMTAGIGAACAFCPPIGAVILAVGLCAVGCGAIGIGVHLLGSPSTANEELQKSFDKKAEILDKVADRINKHPEKLKNEEPNPLNFYNFLENKCPAHENPTMGHVYKIDTLDKYVDLYDNFLKQHDCEKEIKKLDEEIKLHGTKESGEIKTVKDIESEIQDLNIENFGKKGNIENSEKEIGDCKNYMNGVWIKEIKMKNFGISYETKILNELSKEKEKIPNNDKKMPGIEKKIEEKKLIIQKLENGRIEINEKINNFEQKNNNYTTNEILIQNIQMYEKSIDMDTNDIKENNKKIKDLRNFSKNDTFTNKIRLTEDLEKFNKTETEKLNELKEIIKKEEKDSLENIGKKIESKEEKIKGFNTIEEEEKQLLSDFGKYINMSSISDKKEINKLENYFNLKAELKNLQLQKNYYDKEIKKASNVNNGKEEKLKKESALLPNLINQKKDEINNVKKEIEHILKNKNNIKILNSFEKRISELEEKKFNRVKLQEKIDSLESRQKHLQKKVGFADNSILNDKNKENNMDIE